MRRQQGPSPAPHQLLLRTLAGTRLPGERMIPMFKFFLPPGHLPPLLLRDNNHHGDSHLGPVSPFSPLSLLLPTLDSLTPKWRFGSPSESSSFESAATAERRPLSVTERGETRRHGEGTAMSRQLNRYKIPGDRSLDAHRTKCLHCLHSIYISNTKQVEFITLGAFKHKIDNLLKYNRFIRMSISSVCLLRRLPSYV